MANLEIKASKIHGLGAFATQPIGWGQRIIEYTGQKLNNKEGKRRERFYDSIGVNYLFDLSNTHCIDGLVGGNESRFINHNPHNPNCVAIRQDGKVFIHAYIDIKKGEELTFDYGYEV